MCTTCQEFNPFLEECFLNHDPNSMTLFQDISESTDAADTVLAATGGYTLEAGDSFHGYLSSGDRDVISINLEAGVTYTKRRRIRVLFSKN